MLLDIANDYSVSGEDATESRMPNDTLNVYLLIYDIKDGKMAVCFSHTDDARYAGYKQFGVAWMGILKNGEWVTISHKDDTKKWSGRR
jgi:hypothetical protein